MGLTRMRCFLHVARTRARKRQRSAADGRRPVYRPSRPLPNTALQGTRTAALRLLCVQPPSQGRVVEVPRVGGLHHEYLRSGE